MFMNKRQIVVTVLVALLAIFGVLASLSAQEDTSDMEMTEPTVIEITMTEYAFLVDGMEMSDALELTAGMPYTLSFSHMGELEHEVLIGQNAIELAEGMHRDFETSLLGDVEVKLEGTMAGNHFVVGMSGLIEFEMYNGQEINLTFTLPEDKVGDWEMGCFVFLDEDATEENPSPTHYDLMMMLPIIVVAPA